MDTVGIEPTTIRSHVQCKASALPLRQVPILGEMTDFSITRVVRRPYLAIFVSNLIITISIDLSHINPNSNN